MKNTRAALSGRPLGNQFRGKLKIVVGEVVRNRHEGNLESSGKAGGAQTISLVESSKVESCERVIAGIVNLRTVMLFAECFDHAMKFETIALSTLTL